LRLVRVLSLCAVAALLLTSSDAAPQVAPDRSRDLRAAFIASNPAMTVKDAVTGNLGGPAVELARELARRRGVGVNLIGVQTPQHVIDAVANGNADIGLVAYNPEREGSVAFSRPFMLVLQTFVVREDSPLQSVKDIDRPNQRIAARRADSMALYLARTIKQAQLVEITETMGNEGTQGVLSRTWDAFGANRQRLTEALRNTRGLRLLNDDLYGVEQTVIVPKDDQENLKAINQFIDDVRNSGFLRAAIDRSGIIGIAVAPAPVK
jgi:polar amino acid transport system substrate-binding protein